MPLENPDEKITWKYCILGILLGLGFFGSQIHSIIVNGNGYGNSRAVAFSVLIMGIGAMISLISYRTMMVTLYKTSCIIPPEWKDILRDGDESLTIKILILLNMIQHILIVPVVILTMILDSIHPGRGLPVDAYILNFIYFAFLIFGNILFSHFYQKCKKTGGLPAGNLGSNEP